MSLPGADSATLRLSWMKAQGAWKITVYDVDLPWRTAELSAHA